MGKRKRLVAEARKEENKTTYFAKLNSCPTSPRKMRMVSDLIRGKEVYLALNILKYNTKHPAKRLEKLLTSAIANYEQKVGTRPDENSLFVTEIMVDSALMTKRMLPAPQGRAYRMRKRSNHITLVIGSKKQTPERSEHMSTKKQTLKNE